jgi:WD40 repeat protein
VQSAAFTPDGASLLSSGRDGTIRRWDLARGEGRVIGHVDGVAMRLALSPDGRTAVTSGQDRLARAWDLASGTSRVLGAHKSDAYYVFFLDPSRVLVASFDDAVVYDLAAGTTRALPLPEGFGGSIAGSADGRHVAFSVAERIALLDLGTGRTRELLGHDQPVQRVRFSPDGRRLVSGSVDGAVRIWDVATLALRAVHRHDGVVFDAAISADGRLVATASADRTGWVGAIDAASAFPDDPAAVRAALAAWTSAVVEPGQAPRSP